METLQLGTGDDDEDLAAVEWRLGGWQMELMLETGRLGTGDDNGHFVAVKRRQWRLSGCGLDMRMKT